MTENNLHRVLRQRSLEPLHKGLGQFPSQASSARIEELAQAGWRLLAEEVSLPAACLNQRRLEHNLAWMAEFIDHYQLKLAPHGKTSMSPALFLRQLAAGAWGITLATAPQVQVAHHFGVRRVILANQLVGEANMAIIAQLLADPNFECFVLVDCPLNAARLGRFFLERGQHLCLLIELGTAGGRSGVRDIQALESLLEQIGRWPSLSLRGVEIYEGVLKEASEIRAFLRHALHTLKHLQARQLLSEQTPMLTGAGSAWFDLVAEEWAGADIGRPLDIVLRPGCYLTQDLGIYQAAAERMGTTNPVIQHMGRQLQPALQVWAYVTSRPEPGLAILGLGKRDAAFDAGLPIPSLHFRPGRDTRPSAAPAAWQLHKMMDQHAFMAVPADADLQVGDMLALDISHPCLTFDKWQQLLIVDDDYRVVDIVETFF